MSMDLVLHSTDEAFSLAERIARSNLVPVAYRNKPVEAAIAMLYGAEMGMPPMSALQRIVVINGKPSMDAQGMVAMIRQAGHSVSGSVSATDGAKITGKRGDNGDEMTVEWGPEDATRAGLASATYTKFPSDMYWARAVSQLGRRLFADVLLGVSYVPEEAAAIPVNGNGHAPQRAATEVPEAPAVARSSTLRPPPGTPAADPRTGEIVPEGVEEPTTATVAPTPPARDDDVADAEVVENPATTKQINAIKRLLKLNDDSATAHVAGMEGMAPDLKSLADLTEEQADEVIGRLAS